MCRWTIDRAGLVNNGPVRPVVHRRVEAGVPAAASGGTLASVSLQPIRPARRPAPTRGWGAPSRNRRQDLPATTWAGEPEVASAQAGVFTADQAEHQGWSPRQIQRRRSAGAWRRVLGDGLTARRGPIGADAQAWAVQLTWPDAVVGGPTAAAVHGAPLPELHAAWVSSDRRIRARGIVRLAGGADLAPVVVDGLRVAGLVTAVIDSLVVLPEPDAFDLWAWTTTRGVLGRDDLRATALDRYGRKGARRLHDLLRETRGGAVNGGERRLHEILHGAGITGWRAGARVGDGAGVIGVVDVLFERYRLVLELDGRRGHDSGAGDDRFVDDRRRQNRLVNADYTVLRFTWADLVQRPEGVVAEVRAALVRLA